MNNFDGKSYKIPAPGKNLKEKAELTKNNFKGAINNLEKNIGNDLEKLTEQTSKDFQKT